MCNICASKTNMGPKSSHLNDRFVYVFRTIDRQPSYTIKYKIVCDLSVHKNIVRLYSKSRCPETQIGVRDYAVTNFYDHDEVSRRFDDYIYIATAAVIASDTSI